MDSFLILSAAWYYVRSLGYSEHFYGAVIAAQSLGYVLFTPVVGKLSDKTRAVKLVFFIACTFVKVISNFVYAIPVFGYCSLMGCFFSGAANGAFSAIYGEIVRYTINENRAKLFIVVDAVYIFGASCSLLVGEMITFNANILGLNINAGNSPAVVLVIIWFALLCVSLCLPLEFGTKELADEAIVEPESNCPDTLKKSFDSTVWCLFFYYSSAVCLLAHAQHIYNF